MVFSSADENDESTTAATSANKKESRSAVTHADGSLSMSVEETNRLRAELGLKPLEEKPADTEEKIVDAAAVVTSKPTASEIRMKIDANRAKRTREKLLSEGQDILKELTESEEGLTSRDWVRKMRQQNDKPAFRPEEEKDDDSLSEDEDDLSYLSKLRVTHRLKDFQLKTGESISLTLKDVTLLDESGNLREDDYPDLLENEELRLNEERRKRRLERTKKVYEPSLDKVDSDDEEGQNGSIEELQQKNRKCDDSKILPHYDKWAIEAKTVKKPKDYDYRQGFTLKTLEEHPDYQPVPRQEPVSLDCRTGIQRDFYTREEYEEQQKQKKDLLFRTSKALKKQKKRSLRQPIQDKCDDVDEPIHLLGKNKKAIPMPISELGVEPVCDEDDDSIYYTQLSKQKKDSSLSLFKLDNPGSTSAASNTVVAKSVADMVSMVNEMEDNLAQPESGLMSVGIVDIKPEDIASGLSSTVELSGATEFCRAVQTPLEKLEDMQINRLRFNRPQASRRGLGVSDAAERLHWRDNQEDALSTAASGAGEAAEDQSDSESVGEGITEEEKKVVETILSEDLLDGGLISALKYLKAKGELHNDIPRRGKKTKENVPLHMSTTPGDIKLEYRDDYGRIMTPKEAFRYISWVFHGKGPGKRKREKILRKMEVEKKLRTLAPSQTTLPTLIALNKQQKKGQAYVVLNTLPTNSSSSAAT